LPFRHSSFIAKAYFAAFSARSAVPGATPKTVSLSDFAADPAAGFAAAAEAPLTITDGPSPAFVVMTAAAYTKLTSPPVRSVLDALKPDSDHGLIDLGFHLTPRRRDPS
jgi:hypothetical protein